jgi:murein DD-endopeptidase MepM/ murein hydrolase activator NlpD
VAAFALLAVPAFSADTVARAGAVQRSASVVRTLTWIWPADGIVTSPYGPRGGGFHPGLDIGMLRSLSVRAAIDGTVIGSGYLAGYEGYGNLVVVDIGNGYTLIYAHLSRSAVKAGDVLQQGDPIGTAGCTGSCTGTHLHFELRRYGRWADVTPFLP